MSGTTTIEWTRGDDGRRGATWNPVTGCDKVSPGCAHCYAETFAERWRGVPNHPYQQGFDLRMWPERLDLPLRWSKPLRIFVNSMSDLFHERVPDEYIERVFDTMARAHWHTFQVLTKRHERLRELAPKLAWPSNVWMGVSIENRRFVHRADYLRAVPATVRFISAEPLLGPLDGLSLRDIHWVIAGGESGPSARPMHPDWVRELRDRCGLTDTAFFFKQWGAYVPTDTLPPGDGEAVVALDRAGHRSPPFGQRDMVRLKRVGKKRAGRLFEGRTWDEFPLVREHHHLDVASS